MITRNILHRLNRVNKSLLRTRINPIKAHKIVQRSYSGAKNESCEDLKWIGYGFGFFYILSVFYDPHHVSIMKKNVNIREQENRKEIEKTFLGR